ncbi:MAG: ABC transporter ATP-binding protein [Thermoplasmatota archaeon]
MLTINNLHHDYDHKPLLQGVQLEVAPGTIHFVLGPSGCGKSTLLRCIAGLLPDGGAVTWDGEPLGAPHERGVGLLFQEPALFPHLNVWQNVAFGLKYRGVPRADWRAEAGTWLALVGLADRMDAKTDQLSGGQRQRVALARTLAAKPRAVLLDEPLSALDRALRDELGDSIAALLRKQGVAAVWVTHDEEEANRLGDRVERLVEGRLQPL